MSSVTESHYDERSQRLITTCHEATAKDAEAARPYHERMKYAVPATPKLSKGWALHALLVVVVAALVVFAR